MRKVLLLLLSVSFTLTAIAQNQLAKIDDLMERGFYLFEAGSYEDALKSVSEALKITEEVSSKDSEEFAIILSFLGQIHFNLSNYSEAINNEKEVLQIIERNGFLKEFSYSTRELLVRYYLYAGNYPEAIKLGEETLFIYGKDSSDFRLLNNLAACYSAIGDYDKAYSFYVKALEKEEALIEKEALGSESYYLAVYFYVVTMNDLAECCSESGNIRDAIVIGNKALQIEKANIESMGSSVTESNYFLYISLLSNMSKYYANIHEFKYADTLCTKALEMAEKVVGREHSLYASTLHTLAYIKSGLKNYSEAIDKGKEALVLEEKKYGKEHHEYIKSCDNLAFYYSCSGDTLGVEKYINQYFDITQGIIKTNFKFLTEKERECFWKKYQNSFMNFIQECTFNFQTTSLKKVGCNALLMGKGLLLNTSQEISALMNMNDSKTMELFNELRMNRLLINRQYEIPISERTINIDSLEYVANDQERKLIEKSKEFGDYTSNISITWQNIQNSIGKKDVCVEFVSFSINPDTTMYAAYIIKPGIPNPIYVPLCEEKKIQAVAEKAYTSSELSKLIWKKIADEGGLDGVKNIYFSPSGELHNIAIESMLHWDDSGKLMSECGYNFYRLSSTRELAMKRSKVKGYNRAVLYGGMKYSCPISVMEAALNEDPSEDNSSTMTSATDEESVRNDFSDYMAYNDMGIGSRGFDPVASMLRGEEWKDLKHTKAEVDSIQPTLSQRYVVKLRSDTAATETSFKRLSGKKNKIIHIATHGFYWDEAKATEETKELDNSTMRQESHEKTLPFVQMNNAMTRSGLVFSGGNHIRKGDSIPPGVDDGVLTAQEVAYLDLRGLDLVVLSACQTGLGDIVGSEGVFGLQRGFKKAGAQAIIMSLWPVHDKATREMMVEFYKGLNSDKTMQQAFHDAQKHVRDRESKGTYGRYYEDEGFSPLRPHWAAFILLDAVEL